MSSHKCTSHGYRWGRGAIKKPIRSDSVCLVLTVKLWPVIKWQQERILFIPQTHCPHFSAKLALPQHTAPILPSHKSVGPTRVIRGTAVDHSGEPGQAARSIKHSSKNSCKQKYFTFLELCFSFLAKGVNHSHGSREAEDVLKNCWFNLQNKHACNF